MVLQREGEFWLKAELRYAASLRLPLNNRHHLYPLMERGFSEGRMEVKRKYWT